MKTPLHIAASTDSIKAIEFLLEKGADLHARNKVCSEGPQGFRLPLKEEENNQVLIIGYLSSFQSTCLNWAIVKPWVGQRDLMAQNLICLCVHSMDIVVLVAQICSIAKIGCWTNCCIMCCVVYFQWLVFPFSQMLLAIFPAGFSLVSSFVILVYGSVRLLSKWSSISQILCVESVSL